MERKKGNKEVAKEETMKERGEICFEASKKVRKAIVGLTSAESIALLEYIKYRLMVDNRGPSVLRRLIESIANDGKNKD